jgi:hypothetical protein
MYDKFEELGIPSSVVDGYADNIYKEQTEFTNKVYELAGGQEEFVKIKDWAEDGNISQAELDAIGELPFDAMLGAMQGIKARYDQAIGKNETNPKKITGNQKQTSGSSYTSQEDYLKDVADKRYGQNRAYTEAVERKYSNSKF